MGARGSRGEGHLHVLLLNSIGGENFGGVERWMLDVGDHLVQQGHRVVSLARGGSYWGAICRDRGYPTYETAMRGDFHPADVWRVKRIYRDHGIDLVVAKSRQCVRMAWAARLVALRRLPAILCVQGGIVMKRSLRTKLTYRYMADRHITPSEYGRRELLGYGYFPPERIRAVPNGVVIPPADPTARGRLRAELGLGDAPALSVVSRLHPDKGIQDLLRATAGLRADFPALRLLVVGDGAYRSSLEQQTGRLGLEDAVLFTGFRTDVNDLLRAADVFVLPSYHENMPYGVLEAMAAGLPVVATAVGGVPEVVVDGETGILVPPRDAGPLQDALASLLRDPAAASAMGHAGTQRVRAHFTRRHMLEATEAYCLETRRSRA
ncbi:MAG: glycosyltransferase family 4 protein [Planctomycetota bacterium]